MKKPAVNGPKDPLLDVYNVLKIFLRCFVYSVLFWSFGRYAFSPVWLILFAVVQTVERRYHLLRLERIRFFEELTTDVRPALETRLSEFPSWITYPDFDRCEWLNKFIAHLWPTVSDYVQNFVKNTVEPELRKQLAHLSFERIDLGDFPPRLGGVKLYTENLRPDEIILDTEFFYGGDMQIKMKYHSLTAGIKSIYLHGELRLILKSIVSKIPFVGALEIFFLRTPTIDFDLTDVGNIIEIPGLHNLLMSTLERMLQATMVIPNRLIVAFMDDVDVDQLRFPKPDGVLRVDIIEARNVPKLDSTLGLVKHASDAFASVSIGQYKFKTHTQRSCNPRWDETFEVPVEESNTQQLQISVFDADLTSDDYIGTIHIRIETIKDHDAPLDQWYDVVGTKNSAIHICLNWFYLSARADSLPQIERINREHVQRTSSKVLHTLSTSLLIVYVERAEQLPAAEHGKALEPHPFCAVKVENHEEKTTVKKNCTNPRWMQSFMFMLVNPEQSLLQINVNDSNNRNRLIGSVELPVKSLMSEKDWTSNRAYPLRNSLDSKLYVRLQLQLMTKERPSIAPIETESYVSLESSVPVHVVTQHRPPAAKKASLVQRLFSSCIKNRTEAATVSTSNNFISATYGFR